MSLSQPPPTLTDSLSQISTQLQYFIFTSTSSFFTLRRSGLHSQAATISTLRPSVFHYVFQFLFDFRCRTADRSSKGGTK
ncbi:hypothetical protein L6452_26607 [Arctium lappa]|uniref:Uncharacterized protein n=1 Tax=Arctium lappa TaxID=4217 RepID=A0ACB8ZUI2_ARCLA|nr:hypothetical protein L6452_26607 [Arctium lappa]